MSDRTRAGSLGYFISKQFENFDDSLLISLKKSADICFDKCPHSFYLAKDYSFSLLTFIQAFFMLSASSSMMGLSQRMRPLQLNSFNALKRKLSFKSDSATGR